MKYLIYFKPDQELADMILKQEHIKVPGSGLHSTILFFNMQQRFEHRLVQDLHNIEFDPFTYRTENFADFDDDAFVIKLSKSSELQKLHQDILSVTRPYANQDSNSIFEKYFGENYSPHITISKSHLGFDKTNTELLKREYQSDEFYLARKEESGLWSVITKFEHHKPFIID